MRLSVRMVAFFVMPQVGGEVLVVLYPSRFPTAKVHLFSHTTK